jgi:hypothetical protein
MSTARRNCGLILSHFGALHNTLAGIGYGFFGEMETFAFPLARRWL